MSVIRDFGRRLFLVTGMNDCLMGKDEEVVSIEYRMNDGMRTPVLVESHFH